MSVQITYQCEKHREYLGVFKPRQLCEPCWEIFRIRNGLLGLAADMDIEIAVQKGERL